MQEAHVFCMNVWRVCVYECNIVSISIHGIYTLCIGWVSAICIYL